MTKQTHVSFPACCISKGHTMTLCERRIRSNTGNGYLISRTRWLASVESCRRSMICQSRTQSGDRMWRGLLTPHSGRSSRVWFCGVTTAEHVPRSTKATMNNMTPKSARTCPFIVSAESFTVSFEAALLCLVLPATLHLTD